MKLFFSLCVAFAAVPTYSLSADWGEGTAALGYLAQDDRQEFYNFVDFTLRLEGKVWGAEIGAFGVAGGLHETYAAVTYRTASGKLSFGNPRPAYDDFATSSLTDLLPLLSLDTIGDTRSRATFGTMTQSKFLPFGARYSAQEGQTDYAVSLHWVPDYPDVILAGAMHRTQGPWTYELAVEAVQQDASTRWNAKAQVARDFGTATLGFGVFDQQANTQTTSLEIFGRIAALEQTELTGLLRLDEEGRTALGGGLSYRFFSRWSLQAGVFGHDTSDVASGATLRVQF